MQLKHRRVLLSGSKMLSFLKVMYYFGYLPFHWTSAADVESGNPYFKISITKSNLILIFDFLMALTIPAYFSIWHWLHVDGFDMRLLLTGGYYVGLHDGKVTTTLSQTSSIIVPCFFFWSYSAFGEPNFKDS